MQHSIKFFPKHEISEAQVTALAEGLRASDIADIESAGFDRYEAVKNNIQGSTEAAIVEINGEVVLGFGFIGFTAIGEKRVCPWFFGTDKVDSYKPLIARASKEVVRRARKKYDKLENFVFSGNRSARRWLSWLGANISENPVKIGPKQNEYHYFTL